MKEHGLEPDTIDRILELARGTEYRIPDVCIGRAGNGPLFFFLRIFKGEEVIDVTNEHDAREMIEKLQKIGGHA